MLGTLGIGGKLRIASGLPMVIATIFASAVTLTEVREWREQERLRQLASLVAGSTGLVHELQAERGMSAGFVASGGRNFAEALPTQRRRVDSAMQALTTVTQRITTLAGADTVRAVLRELASLPSVRDQVTRRDLTPTALLGVYSARIGRLIDVLDHAARSVNDADARTALRELDAITRLKEWTGRERAALNSAFARGQFDSLATYRAWLTALSGQQAELAALRRSGSAAIVALADSVLNTAAAKEVAGYRAGAMEATPGTPLSVSPQAWFAAASAVIDQWRVVERASTDAIERRAGEQAAQALRLLVLVALVAVALLLVSAVIAWRTIGDILRVTRRVTTRTEEVRERLLAQIQRDIGHLSEGNLEVAPLPVVEKLGIASRDELGVMAASLDGMIDAVRATGTSVVQLQTTLADLVSSSRGIADAAVDGRLEQRADAMRFRGQFGALVAQLNRTMDAIEHPLNEASRVLVGMAERDLTVSMQGEYAGAYGTMKAAADRAVQQLADALLQVRASVEQVDVASQHIAAASESLAENAQREAHTIHAVEETVQVLVVASDRVAENSAALSTQASQARAQAARGTAAVHELGGAMEAITTTGAATSRIIRTIDEIAFQTNLLALNAAVEAARAGDAGRGFAVVAEEVRNLALRSAEAARQTSELLGESVIASQRGAALRDHVAETLDLLVAAVEQVDAVADALRVESEHQQQQVRHITARMDELNVVAQSVAATAEEGAASAEELRAQAARLTDTARAFRTGLPARSLRRVA